MGKQANLKKSRREKLQTAREINGLIPQLGMLDLIKIGVVERDSANMPTLRRLDAVVNAQSVYRDVLDKFTEGDETSILRAFPYGSSDENYLTWIEQIVNPVMSPYDNVWIEFRSANLLYGAYITSKDYSNFVSVWTVPLQAKYGWWHEPHYGGYMETYHDSGRLDFIHSTDPVDIERLVIGTVVALRTFEFLNCRNIVLVDEALKSTRETLYQKHFGVPATRYKTLSIKPIGKRHENDNSQQQFDIMPLHLRRGNFATYTDDAPLFGKYTGTFWRPATVVGNEKNGVVVKDYKVSA